MLAAASGAMPSYTAARLILKNSPRGTINTYGGSLPVALVR